MKGWTLADMMDAVYDAADECGECEYHHCWREPHGETLCECQAKDPRDCPGVGYILKNLTDQYERGKKDERLAIQ